jgi:hypothetical protein
VSYVSNIPYASQVIASIPRALALLDRNSSSHTYGCFDRSFWQYRTITNISGATWQQLVLPLAIVYKTESSENPYVKDPDILHFIRAALMWWIKLQHRDGSFDEWYLNEHSYCPTAFTSAAVVLTMIFLEGEIPQKESERIVNALKRSCSWLAGRYNREVMNQNLAAALTLYGFGQMTSDSRWHRKAVERYRRLAKDQNQEGWFPEYGGADYGYSTLALDLLAAADSLKSQEVFVEMAGRLSNFLFRVSGHGDGYAGRLGSRGTSHIFPYGVEYFASYFPEAAVLAKKWRSLYLNKQLSGPESFDDRYFAYFYLPQFAQAYAGAKESLPPAEEVESEVNTDMTGCGLYIARKENWSATVSLRLGCAIGVEKSGTKPSYHLGYEVKMADGKRYSTANWCFGPIPPIEGGLITRTNIPFQRTSDSLPLSRFMIPFQAVTLLLGIAGRLAETFQKIIKGRMVKPLKTVGLILDRRVEFQEDRIIIADTITCSDSKLQVKWLYPTMDIAFHSPSARQDSGSLIVYPSLDAKELAQRLVSKGYVSLIFDYDPISGEINLTVDKTSGT